MKNDCFLKYAIAAIFAGVILAFVDPSSSANRQANRSAELANNTTPSHAATTE